MKCSECGSTIPHDSEKCPTCGTDAGAPNVREVSLAREKEALERRYNKAIKDAHADGRDVLLEEFSQACKNSRAVIAIDLDSLMGFMTKDVTLYSSYALMVSGEIRKAASSVNDKKRRGVEGFMFGSYANKIRYAALSLDGKGLSSYGPFTLVLKDVAVRTRATLLEENSYKFYDRFKVKIPDNFPPGYRSIWGERHKLAVAKLANCITATTTNDEFSGILLSSNAARETDDFIEVHIFGAFDNAAVEMVVGKSRTSSKADKAQLAVIKEKLIKKGVKWVES
jgi:hypothetical protein